MHAVAARLHVPEQSLAQSDQRRLVLDDTGCDQVAEGQIGFGAGNGNFDRNGIWGWRRPGAMMAAVGMRQVRQRQRLVFLRDQSRRGHQAQCKGRHSQPVP